MARPRCMALTNAGDQCRNRAARGHDYCASHGPKAVGPPSKLNEALILALAEKARTGLYRQEIAVLAGVNTKTLYRWLEQGAADEEAGNTNTLHARLCQSLREAEAEAEDAMVEVIRTAAVGRRVEAYDRDGEELDVNIAPDWRAAAFYLERRYPVKYGRRDKVTVDGDAGQGSKPVIVTVDDDVRRSELAALLERAGALDLPEPQG